MWKKLQTLFVKAVSWAASPEGQALIKEGVDIAVQVKAAKKK